jgi:hypothetical protein
MPKPNNTNNICICSTCNKEILKFQRKIREEYYQPSLFPEIEKKRKKIIKRIEQKQVLIEDDYKSYTVLFEMDLKNTDVKLLKRVLLELNELKAKIERREVLVTRIFYDCKKETKKEAGYKISSEFFRNKQNIVNASRNTKEEMAVIEEITVVMGSISGLYRKFKKEDMVRELGEIKKLTKI